MMDEYRNTQRFTSSIRQHRGELDGVMLYQVLCKVNKPFMLNGFAAPMAAGTIQRLKADSRVLAVKWDSPVSFATKPIPPASRGYLGRPALCISEPLDSNIFSRPDLFLAGVPVARGIASELVWFIFKFDSLNRHP